MPSPPSMFAPVPPRQRWARFGVVGLVGVAVQVVALVVLADVLAVHLQVATLAAVSLAIVHNFAWHRRWTWSDRRTSSASMLFVRFSAANGLVSLVGNTAIVGVLVDGAGVPTVVASLIAIALCGLLNYVLADRLVFALRAGVDPVGSATLPSAGRPGNHWGRRCPSKVPLRSLAPFCWWRRQSASPEPGSDSR